MQSEFERFGDETGSELRLDGDTVNVYGSNMGNVDTIWVLIVSTIPGLNYL